MQLELFPEALHLTSIDAARNRRRYYALSVDRTLFGEWVLCREWGRIGATGRMRHDPHLCAGEALNALLNMARMKVRRGYHPA